METLITALATVLIVEGLVYALAPSIVERVLDALRAMPIETRRLMGLATMATGVAMLWVMHAV